MDTNMIFRKSPCAICIYSMSQQVAWDTVNIDQSAVNIYLINNDGSKLCNRTTFQL